MLSRSYSIVIWLAMLTSLFVPISDIHHTAPLQMLRITLNADQQVRSWCIPTASDPYSTFAEALRNPTFASLLSVMQSYGARQCRTESQERQALFSQPTEANQAALVIDFGDGRVQTFCIELANPTSTTGEEVLRASNLPVVIEYNPGVGAAICKIGDVGTNFPNEPCFAQCTLRPNEPCEYWIYSRMVDGVWQYSQLGAGNVTVQPGDVEGWLWTDSNAEQRNTPPLFRFSDICTGMPPTAIPTATATPTVPTPTRRPTKVPLPTETPEITREAVLATPTPTTTPQASATTTNTPNAMPITPSATPIIPTPSPLPSVTATHAAVVEPTAPPTNEPTAPATTIDEPPTPTPSATATEQSASNTIARADEPTIAAPTALQAMHIHLPWIEQALSSSAEAVQPAPLPPTTAPTPIPIAPAPNATNNTPVPQQFGQARSNYLGFAFLAIVLQLVWVWMRRKRGTR